ncbi:MULTISPECIES: hypothetical protein [Roseomonadaceae]|uniref:Uncharacterized protein n=1 Tax=Falsiroseomonas oleicola TaxID=2801474 RepID=A0ABS6H6L2_9PROT|nr:hypothetical protein [Roseomonas oleicola]MBU8543996.1 hypothetical protein [Roseomonas oleicola]
MTHPILAAGQTREVPLGGTSYTLRALTHAQVSSMQMAALAMPRPGEAVVSDAMRAACEARGKAELASAFAEHDAAQDALSALFFTRPSLADAAGLAEWTAQNAAELRAAQRAVLAAERRRGMAVYAAEGDAEVIRLRQELIDAVQFETACMVSAGVIAIDGKEIKMTVDEAGLMPAGHVAGLVAVLREMAQPNGDAVKN